jgi:hypothetical protein
MSDEAENVQMVPKHTPGPWPYTRTGDGKRITIGAGLVEGPNGYEVAEVYSDDCDAAEAEANARLIAAAPDLLAALQWVMSAHGEQLHDALAAANEAIARATGAAR